MSTMLILDPIELNAPMVSANAETGFGAENLTDPQPLVLFKAKSAGSVAIDLDLGKDHSLDCVYLGYTNMDASASWEIRSATASEGLASLANASQIRLPQTQARASFDALGPRYHAFWHSGNDFTARYIRLIITNPPAALNAGVLAVGKAFRPTFNHEWQSGRGLIDTSLKSRLRSGAMAVEAGAIVPTWRWTLGDLTDADVQKLWRIARHVGESRPILVAEDPAVTEGLHERLHYGTLRDFQEYSRESPNKTRWDFTIEEWA